MQVVWAILHGALFASVKDPGWKKSFQKLEGFNFKKQNFTPLQMALQMYNERLLHRALGSGKVTLAMDDVTPKGPEDVDNRRKPSESRGRTRRTHQPPERSRTYAGDFRAALLLQI